MIADVPHVGCSEFEEFRLRALAALQELPTSLGVLSSIQDSTQQFPVGVLALHWVGRILQHHFLVVSRLLMQEDLSKLGALPQEVTNSFNKLGLA